jgi:hypothetical protein
MDAYSVAALKQPAWITELSLRDGDGQEKSAAIADGSASISCRPDYGAWPSR